MPAWLYLAVLVSLLVAVVYQILRASSLRRVPLYWLVLLAGLLAAEGAAEAAHLRTPHLGELQLIPDLAGVALAAGLLRLARL
ncbi:MAG TPA: hypothetical protein VFB34_04815 [Chloroflexota bacterium]|nr:hypothetical protein [Chloroflexota bacterium]